MTTAQWTPTQSARTETSRTTGEEASAPAALHARAHLACVRGPDLGLVIAVDHPRILGRCGQPPLSAPSASRHHARLTPVARGRGRARERWGHGREVVGRLVDLGSANGTRVRRRHGRTSVLRGRASAGAALAIGDRLDLGEDRFVVRARPDDLAWPEADSRRGRMRTVLPWLPAVLVPAMLASRLLDMTAPASKSILSLVLLGLLVVLLVVAGARWRASRRRWQEVDAAQLALVLASQSSPPHHHEEDRRKDAGGTGPRGPHPGEVWPIWPNRPGPRGSLMVCSGTSGATPARTGAERLAGPGPRRSRQRPIARVGLVGAEAARTARWIVAQIAARAGGVDLTDEEGNRRVLGGGGRAIHLASGALCPGCASAPGDETDHVLHVGLAPSFESLPTWCDTVVRAEDAPASLPWWDQVARPRGETDARVLPSRVLFADRGPVDPERERPHDEGDLPVVIGRDATGPVVVDLVRDGPHALVAGTTGSGKSEALMTWLLALCADHGPDRLRVVLIDYKGGAALAPLARLPQAEEVLTDLDPARTERAIRGLTALLKTREGDLAHLGLPDLLRWQRAYSRGDAPAPPPRVVIVVDEFRVLADQHPQTLDALVRLCAQGRSLGLHLVLATQRPSGAITPAMRANIELRVALRCADEADALDVAGTPKAARLPRIPGRALIRGRGTLQIAWAPDVVGEVSSLLTRWGDSGAVREALWTPGLPTQLSWEGIDRIPLPDGVEAPVIGMADGIDVGIHLPLVWETGSLKIEGPLHEGEQLGRAAIALAARTAAVESLPLHVCAGGPADSHCTCATWIRGDDAGSCAHLLVGLPEHGPAVLCVQDAPALIDALESALGPGRGLTMWDAFMALTARNGIRVVAACPRRVGGASASSFVARLIRVGSGQDAIRAGLRADVPRCGPAGRFLGLGPGIRAVLPPSRSVEGSPPMQGTESRPLVCQVPQQLPTSWSVVPDGQWGVRSLDTGIASPPAGPAPAGGPTTIVCRIGDGLRPWIVRPGLRWVIVARDPTTALAAIERAHSAAGLPIPPVLDASAKPGPRPAAHEAGIVLINPRQCTRASEEPGDILLAPNPDVATLRVLATAAQASSPALMAERWTPSTGLALIDARLVRMALVMG